MSVLFKVGASQGKTSNGHVPPKQMIPEYYLERVLMSGASSNRVKGAACSHYQVEELEPTWNPLTSCCMNHDRELRSMGLEQGGVVATELG